MSEDMIEQVAQAMAEATNGGDFKDGRWYSDEHRAVWRRRAEVASGIIACAPRPIADYHEDMGDVLWWKFPIVEPPYVGSPNDLGFEAIVETRSMIAGKLESTSIRRFVGGWPGYHTHFTPIPIPQEPKL